MQTDDDTYTAANIRVLTTLASTQRFAFARAEELARLHPHVAPAFVARLVESCHLSGWSVDLAERRYLLGDTSVTPPPAFYACHAELTQRARMR